MRGSPSRLSVIALSRETHTSQFSSQQLLSSLRKIFIIDSSLIIPCVLYIVAAGGVFLAVASTPPSPSHRPYERALE